LALHEPLHRPVSHDSTAKRARRQALYVGWIRDLEIGANGAASKKHKNRKMVQPLRSHEKDEFLYS
jgi:hypothetical protein